MTRPRTPAGVPAGGQFTASARTEGGVILASPDPVLGTDPPLVEFDEVYHVGTLDAADRKGGSYEGEGLSVSLHPDEWSQIAKLPGQTWTLERADGDPLRLVSWHDLDDVVRGQARGWVRREEVYVLRKWDDEYEQWLSFEFLTREEAEAEAEFAEDDIASDVSWRATDDFPGRVYTDVDCSDVLLAAYVRHERPDLDGVWWEDDYDPDVLSCPRGVLVHDLDRYERNAF